MFDEVRNSDCEGSINEESTPAQESCVADSSSPQEDDEETTKLNKMDSKKLSRKFGEKIRRDRLNNYITELASEVPVIAGYQNRLDKATVLRLTVSYMKLHHGLKKKKLTQVWRPKILPQDKILNALDEAANGVLMVICKDGSILYVSSKVHTLLGHTQVELLGSNILTHLHPDDVEMFESQFNNTGNNTRVIIENHSKNNHHRFNTIQGQNRTFYVRFASSTKNDKNQVGYKMLHVTASLLEDSLHSEESSKDRKNVWMVAVCRPVSQALDQELSLTMSEFQKDNEWVSQHSLDGKILFSDNRFSLITGIMTSETRGKSPYLFLVMEDLDVVALSHSKIMDVNEISSTIFRMKTVLGNEVYVESSSVIIMDSWTKQGKFIVSINRCLDEGEGRAKLAAQRKKVQELQVATKRLSITSKKHEDQNDKVSTSSSYSSPSHDVAVTDPVYFEGSSNSSQSDCSSVDISNTNSELCTCLSKLPDTSASSRFCSQVLTQMWQEQSSPFNRNQLSSVSPTAETWTSSPTTDTQQNSPSSFIPAQKQTFLSFATQSSNFDMFNNGSGNMCHARSSVGNSSCSRSCSDEDFHSPHSSSSSIWSASSHSVGKKRQLDSMGEHDPLDGLALGATDSPDVNIETDEKDEHSIQGIMGFCDCKYVLSNNQNYMPEVTKPASHSEEQHELPILRCLLEIKPVLDGNRPFLVSIHKSNSSNTSDTVEQHQWASESVPVPVAVQTHLSEQLQNKLRMLHKTASSQTQSIKDIDHNLTQFSQEILTPNQQKTQKVLTSKLKTMEDEVENQKQDLEYLASKLDKAVQHKCSDNTV